MFTPNSSIVVSILNFAPSNKIVENVETQQKPNTLAVDYNSIHCTHIAATKELHQLVQSQQEEITTLESELSAIKAHLGL